VDLPQRKLGYMTRVFESLLVFTNENDGLSTEILSNNVGNSFSDPLLTPYLNEGFGADKGLSAPHILPDWTSDDYGLAAPGALWDDPQFFDNAGNRGQGAQANGKISFTSEQAAAQITRSGANWGPAGIEVTYAYRSTEPATMPSDTAGFTRFNVTQIEQTELSLQSWADVANITFTRVGTGTSGEGAFSNTATMLFANYSSGSDGAAAFAYFPGNTGFSASSGDSWYNSTLSYNALPALGNYGRQVLLHEIGHTIGLSHPGTYNASAGAPPITYANSAEYYEDSRMYTLMSYFGSSNTGGDLPMFGSAPMLDDIAAVQRLYGANMSTRAGDTVYGFNDNTGRDFYAASVFGVPVFAVWDGAGFDTLDFSGYANDQIINLGEGSFSNIGGSLGNIAIAYGAIIEKAIGGSGNDILYAGFGTTTTSYARSYIGYSSTANILVKGQATTNFDIANAINIDSFFTLAPNVLVENSTTIPHAEIQAVAHGGLEYYSFNISEAGSIGTFDIDLTSTGLDAYLYLYDAAGNLLFSNDDSPTDFGSTRTLDSYLSYTFGAAGTYYIVVNEWSSTGFGDGPNAGETYTLQVSIALPDIQLVNSYQGYELDGGAGNDRLYDSAGDDTFTGGAGADIFTFGYLTGQDIITDFEDGIDKIDLSALPDEVMVLDGRGGLQTLLADALTFVQNGADAWVVIAEAGKNPIYTIDDALIIIQNTLISDLTLADDFILGA
jgi:peptidase M10/serralysin-like protein/pre-peptidase/matrixin/hemolysin type calcium-binding protein